MSHLESVPNELKNLFIEYLNIDDLKSLYLVYPLRVNKKIIKKLYSNNNVITLEQLLSKSVYQQLNDNILK